MVVVDSRWLCAVVVLAGFGLAAAPASAQSFWQQLFGGFGAPAEPASKETPARKNIQKLTSYGDSSWHPGYDEVSNQPAYGGSYRTLCVRTCDGFYWPVSASVSTHWFERDVKVCESSCAGEAKLFYMPMTSDDVKNMSDLNGRTYSSFQNAFVYRKTLIKGCGCKAAPWSQAEANRHLRYAAEAAERHAETIASAAALDRKVAEALVFQPDLDTVADADGNTPNEKTIISLAALAGPDAALAADAALLESTLMPSGDRFAMAQPDASEVAAQFKGTPKKRKPWRQTGLKAKRVKTASAGNPFAWLFGN